MKALVTGGAGFIGSHLSELLLADGWEVWALDDLSTGNGATSRTSRTRGDFHLVVDSVLSPSTVNELVNKCDVVYHLAAAVGVRLIVEQPVHTMVTNVQGTENVLDHGSRFGKRVLVASSSEVYGDHREERPLEETARRIYGPTTGAAGSTPTRRRWTSTSRSDSTGARPRLRDRSALQHGRPAAERPVRDGDPALRREGARGRTARDSRRRNADTLFLPRAGHDSSPQRPDGRGLGLRRDLQRRLHRADRDLELAHRVLAATGSSSEIVFIPYDQVYGLGIEDMLHRDPGDREDRAAIGWSPEHDLNGSSRT